jgi:hypothetical protein
MNTLLIPGIEITSISTRADRGLKVIMITPELAPDKMADIFNMQNKFGIAAFSLEEIAITELKAIDEAVSELGTKDTSPSARLQKALYARWANDASLKTLYGDYKAFYAHQMEGFIESVKSKINKNTF